MAEDPAPEPRYITITPSPAAFRVIRQAMAESVTSYSSAIDQLTELIERVNHFPGRIFREESMMPQEADWVQDGLHLVIAQKEASIATLQGGIAEIDRCYPPEEPLPPPQP